MNCAHICSQILPTQMVFKSLWILLYLLFDIQFMRDFQNVRSNKHFNAFSSNIWFRPFKWLTCCNQRYFWKGMLNLSNGMMNAFFASNIFFFLTMLEILKPSLWTVILSPWSLTLLILILVLFPCSLSSNAKSSLIKVPLLPKYYLVELDISTKTI